MTYEEALSFLYSQLPMYQRQGKSAYKKDLSNTLTLLAYLDNPHEKFKSIHIAGTNGKGSSAHLIAAILQLSGYKTGLYTSPHLRSFTERIKINGREVEQRFVADFVRRTQKLVLDVNPSFFEMTVAMSFTYFAERKVDIAVIETGLGGRLDSTNVLSPEVSLITNIGYDHIDILGSTLPEIAFEKAGIIKPHTPVVIGSYQEEVFEVFQKKATENNAVLVLPDYEHRDQKPYYIRKNLNGVLGVIDQLDQLGWKVAKSAIEEGINRVRTLTHFKGRYQIIDQAPLTIADVSHNMDGLSLLIENLKKLDKQDVYFIYGSVRDKELDPILSLFPKHWNYLWTTSAVPRSLDVENLKEKGKKEGLEGLTFANVNKALKVAKKRSSPNDLIVATGSTFLVAEIENL